MVNTVSFSYSLALAYETFASFSRREHYVTNDVTRIIAWDNYLIPGIAFGTTMF